ncbi:MAG: protein kinase [Acidobacteria bacterium]|nr:protein kinase [Acidobacteriota bacterium]
MQWDIEQLFHEVADLESEERAAHFARLAVPQELREELEALLRHDGGLDVEFPIEPLGEACGPYRLIRKLGAGGMATVYLAKRADGEIEQKVAIKLLHRGADAPWLIGRFLRERQILASLQHPGIARLLDAGRTASGQPYLVMEYVDGTPIDVYCERLPLRKRIEVILQVCDAVAYAHRNLVIHRDLKPSNILVDAGGHAKLLDFGIAKILDTATDVTRTRERMMTPEYASPEQVNGGAQTTATDVYQMGAVLYKLLTGSSPHVFASDAESIEFVIARKEPLAASKLKAGVPQDLDFILAMALRKEPESRYPSMEALMEDLRAFLVWRPVRARAGNVWYRIGKFARRYWVPVTAGGVAVMGLAAGLLVAEYQRSVAQRRFTLVRQMANRFFSLDGDLAQLTGSTKVRHKLVTTSLEYLKALESEAKGDPELAVEVAEAYVKVASVQGVPVGPNLGEAKDAEASLQHAAALLEPLLRKNPGDKAALVLSAVVKESRMILADNDRRGAESRQLAKEATDQAERALAIGGLSKQQTADASRVILNVALHHWNAHRYEESVRLARMTVDNSKRPGAELYEGPALSLLANGLRMQGNLDAALASIREARKVTAEAKFPSTHHKQMSLFGVIWREGLILGEEGGISLGRPEEAARALGEALDIAVQAAANDRADTDSRIRLSTAARELGQVLTPRDPKRALAVFDQGLQALAEAKPSMKTKLATLQLLVWSSYPLRALQRGPEAAQRIARAFALAKETGRYPTERHGLGSDAVDLLRANAEQEAAAGRQVRAAEIYRELVQRGSGEPEEDLGNALWAVTVYRRLAELTSGAEPAVWMKRRAELQAHWVKKMPGNAFVAKLGE